MSISESRWKTEIEMAYRRGVHQAIGMLDDHIHEDLEVDPASVLDVARRYAKAFRHDNHEHRHLMHEIIEKVKEEAQ